MRYPAAVAVSVLSALLIAGQVAWAVPGLSANLVLNGGAEQGKGVQPSIWFAAQVPAEGLRMWRDTYQARFGAACLAIVNTHDYDQTVSNNWAQPLQQVPVGKALQVSAYIQTNDADAANVCLQCWDRTATTMLAFASTPVVRGSQDWEQLRSEPVVVPDSTASIMVRAALTGKGEARFDDIAVALADTDTSSADIVPAPKSDKPSGTASTAPAAGRPRIEADLAQAVPGRILAVRPVIKDQMILAYMPDWSHGRVDNIGIANNDGGVRTLIAWQPVTTEQAQGADRRFWLALYSRDTHVGEEAGAIGVYRVKSDWDEQTSWKKQPPTDPGPISTAGFSPGDGWKIFDVTPAVLAGAEQAGVILRFDREDRKNDWSGYQFVSREGAGQWKARRPVLLVVETGTKAVPQTQGAGLEVPRPQELAPRH
jgi:hypothetical protein